MECIKTTVYRAKDGALFLNEEDCRNHENSVLIYFFIEGGKSRIVSDIREAYYAFAKGARGIKQLEEDYNSTVNGSNWLFKDCFCDTPLNNDSDTYLFHIDDDNNITNLSPIINILFTTKELEHLKAFSTI